MRLRSRTVLVAAVVAVAAGVVVAVTGLPWPAVTAVLTGALVALVALDVALAPRPATVEVRRQLPDAITLGGTGDVSWTVANPASRPLTVHLADELAPSLRCRRRVSARLGPRATVRVSTPIEPTRRGRFTPTRLVVQVEGPLGLAARQAERDLPGVLRVLPDLHSRLKSDLRLDRDRIAEVGQRSARGRGGGSEFEQLRDYTVDDEYRHIDWAATARAGRTIVRQYRPERHQDVMVVLDTGRLMAARIGGIPRLEHAMDAAIVLAAAAGRLRDRVGMVTFSSRVRAVVPPAPRVSPTARLTQALFDLEPELAEPDYETALLTTMAWARRRSLVVLLTDLVDEALEGALLPIVPTVAARHRLVVVAVEDPEIRRWVTVAPDGYEEAMRAAAAVEADGRRRRAAARLAGVGAVVLDRPPGQVNTALVDLYLELKATHRI
jgi:uncharacterized protein (DUF58 family)